MNFYAQRRRRLLSQVVADVLVLLWAVVWWLTGSFVHDSIASVAVPARQTAATTEQISDQLRDAGGQAAEIPAIGEQLRLPFESAADALLTLRESAEKQVASIERLATIVGWLVFVIPVAIVVLIWLPRRVAFFVRARATQRFLDSSADLDLFALRAMTSQPLQTLAGISDDPVREWRAGNPTVISQLAELELRRSGLRIPEGLVARGSADSAEGLRGDPGWQRMKP